MKLCNMVATLSAQYIDQGFWQCSGWILLL